MPDNDSATTETIDPTPTDMPQNDPAQDEFADADLDIKGDDGQVDWKLAARRDETRRKRVERDLEQTRQQLSESKNAQAQLDAITKALGLSDDTDPDPAKLADDLTKVQAEARAGKVENAVLRAASAAGVNADALTDSRSFMSTVEALDPADENFTTKLGEAITAATDANPALKGNTTPTTPRSGTEIAGTPADGQLTRADLEGMSPEAIVQAKADGRLNDLLGIR